MKAPKLRIPARTQSNPLEKYSLRGRSEQLEKYATSRARLLGSTCLSGEATVIYARHETGKTLITIALLIQAAECNRLVPEKTYYIDVDDSSSGLAEKVRLLEEYGFHVLAQGHEGFKPTTLLPLLDSMIDNDQCRGIFLIFDTVKKFVDLMDKKQSSHFAEVIRRFVMKGGTVLCLAHVNKRRAEDGKPIYAGTSDILDDFDCGYVLDNVGQCDDTGERVVEFTCVKSRGDNVRRAFYSYDATPGLSYIERVTSVQEVDRAELRSSGKFDIDPDDNDIIDAIHTCIAVGSKTKMKIVQHAAQGLGIPQRAVLRVIEKHTGPDPTVHSWFFTREAHGAMIFQSHPRPAELPQTKGSP
jgi:hypothetical protein